MGRTERGRDPREPSAGDGTAQSAAGGRKPWSHGKVRLNGTPGATETAPGNPMTPRSNHAPRRSHRPFGAAAVALLLAGQAPAQKESDASNHDAMVFHAFPEATSYRLIVRDVDQAARTAIERELPFKVHF